MVVRAGQLALTVAAVAVGAAAVASSQGAGHTVDAVLVGGTTPTVTAPPAARPTAIPTTATTHRPVRHPREAPLRHAGTYRTLSR
jgi:hypothetical protein